MYVVVMYVFVIRPFWLDRIRKCYGPLQKMLLKTNKTRYSIGMYIDRTYLNVNYRFVLSTRPDPIYIRLLSLITLFALIDLIQLVVREES